SLYDQASNDAHAMLDQSASRFGAFVEKLRGMAAEMQRELDAPREDLRRGILELPQETAENASQMRRVIVDQIEALAELNRIVARHGRGLDTVEPTNRRLVREEPAYAGAMSQSSRPRADIPRSDMSRSDM